MKRNEKLTILDLNKKIKVCISITNYAKMTLTDIANENGLTLSTYIEQLARARPKGAKNEKRID